MSDHLAAMLCLNLRGALRFARRAGSEGVFRGAFVGDGWLFGRRIVGFAGVGWESSLWESGGLRRILFGERCLGDLWGSAARFDRDFGRWYLKKRSAS